MGVKSTKRPWMGKKPTMRAERTRRAARKIGCLAAVVLGALLLLQVQDTNTAKRHADYVERRRAVIADFDWEGFLRGRQGLVDRSDRQDPLSRRLGELATRFSKMRNGLRVGSLPLICNVRGAALKGNRLHVAPEVEVRFGNGYVFNTYVAVGVPLKGRTTVERAGIELRRAFGTLHARTSCELLFRDGTPFDYRAKAEIKIF
jgi:hypothetical protein